MIPVVLNGQTGSGKTRLLSELASRGFPVIDLESLANHRGSAFGLLNVHGPQPSQTEFEERINSVKIIGSYSKFFFLEYETTNLGKLRIPETIYDLYKTGLQVLLKTEKDRRVQYILDEYLPADKSTLKNCLSRLKDRIESKKIEALDSVDGYSVEKDQFSELNTLLEKEKYREFCFRMLDYYDHSKNYNHSFPYDFIIEDIGSAKNADLLIEFLQTRFVS